MYIVLLVILFFLGASVASFLNVVADRVPLHKSIISPPSHCFTCGHALSWLDLIPVFSYLILRGKCRYCGAQIGVGALFIESVTGLLFILAWLIFGPSIKLILVLLFTAVFIVMIMTGWASRKMPYIFIVTMIVLSLLIAAARQYTGYGPDIIAALKGLAIGYSVIIVLCLVCRFTKWRIVGIYDAIVAILIGAAIGFQAMVFLIVITLLILAVYFVYMQMWKRRQTGQVPASAIMSFLALVYLYSGGFINSNIFTI